MVSPAANAKPTPMNLRLKNNIAVSDSGFVFNPSTGDSFSINPVGVDIIQLMRASKSEKDIISDLCERYDADAQTIEKDLYDFCTLLLQHQLAEKA